MKLREMFDQLSDEIPSERKLKAAERLAKSKSVGSKWGRRFKELNPHNAINRIRHAKARGKPAAEKDLKAIETNPEVAYEYAAGVLRSPWPRGEPAIMKNPGNAALYAMYTLNRRWPEAEPGIAKTPYASGYAIKFFDSRWPEAEPTIFSSPWSATNYARRFNFRLPADVEQVVLASPQAEAYRKHFGI